MKSEMLAASVTCVLLLAWIPASDPSASSAESDELVLPTGATAQLLTGAVFAESSTENVGGEDPDEKLAIGWTFVNMAHYAKIDHVGKMKCYNDSFGDGTIVSAIKKGSTAYETAVWKRVMSGQKLKPRDELLKLQPGDLKHLKLSIDAANAIGDSPSGPKTVAALGGVPIQFNRAPDTPPNPMRQKKIGKLARHTFYGFKAGRECQ